MTDEHYEADTIVVDADGWTQKGPTRSPALREDLSVQIHDDNGVWHRKAVGGSFTACGEPGSICRARDVSRRLSSRRVAFLSM